MLSQRSSTSAYNFSNNLASPITNKIKKYSIENDKKTLDKHKITNLQKDKGFYYNIQVIRKVATFLQNIKGSIVGNKQQLSVAQQFYLQNEEILNQSSRNLISDDNPILLCFQLLFMILSAGCLWSNSFEIVFGADTNLLNKIYLTFFLIYIIIHLNTECRNEKLQIIDSRKTILQLYIKKKLRYDLIILIGLILSISQMKWAVQISRIFILMAFFIFSNLKKKFQNKFGVSVQMQGTISILKLFFKILVFIHFLSLTFNAMSKIEHYMGVYQTWIEKQNIQNSSNFQLYIYGWYWASTIISTVGFGDFTPANVYQCGFISIIQLLCSVMFGYSVNYIGTILGVFGESKDIYEKDIRRLNKYLKTLTIPKTLENGIRSHFYNKYKIQQVYDAQSQQYLFMKLTEKLRNQVNETNNLNIIKKCKMMSIFSEKTLQKFAVVMKKVVYAPSEILFDENSEVVKLFIIKEGKVNQLPLGYKSNNKQRPIITYDKQEQNTIGWLNILTNSAFTSYSQAETYTITYEISRQDFIQVLKTNSKDYFKFQQIKQKITNKPVKYIKKCLVCGRLTHSVVQCPKIHFIPKKASTILLQQKKQIQQTKINQRKKQCRRNQKKQSRIISKQIDKQDICIQSLPQFIPSNRRIRRFETTLGKDFIINKESSSFKKISQKKFNQKLQQISIKQTLKFSAKKLTSRQEIQKSNGSLTKQKDFSNINLKTLRAFENGQENEGLLLTQDQNLKRWCINNFDTLMVERNKQFFQNYHIDKILNQRDSHLQDKLFLQKKTNPNLLEFIIKDILQV